ncbi:family 1 glycosylhydrolase [Opitutus sp. ER46]|uniref:family 1 glycosylhydrolase n=1 Tax=Opitutus sp. ER46 TaxID=2161864 RepID=UPI000D2FB39E|nr:family 1 glycosylhydrolase [Opitutus sp. ER46]PTY00333.1 dTDP-4-dehydrorhamnose reductase [Opitutus sp. ER46]
MTDHLQTPRPAPIEMWGGIECSHVRIGEAVRNQLAQTGHASRLEDLDRIAALGIRALRYPVLWEHHHVGGGQIDWRWADERLGRLRELGIRPIVGLIHHGSGPLAGGLLDAGFVEGLARFARQVAERYPWVDAYTPVNEPGTTARFGGLYGLWHPHARDNGSFGRCFVNECLATRAAMRAIRQVNPAAQLIQTEDIGKVHSTPPLAYQARYENERRWLTFDVLCGRVDPRHPVHAHLIDCGIPRAELTSFVDDPCPPDVLGMNHYVTSERLLDECLERYPANTHGGNGREAYADVDAVRVRAEGLGGVEQLLLELAERYQRPIAITEVQLACTREEQVRWLVEIWQAAESARARGADVRAVTPWALLGAFDWDSLLVQPRGRYETGAFDVRGGRPRLTAVGRAITALAREGRFEHPVLSTPGWWRRPVRLEYPAVPAPATGRGTALASEPRATGRPLLLLGTMGALGRTFLDACALRGLPVVGLGRRQVDVADLRALREVVAAVRPWAVINGTGDEHIDTAERAPANGRRDNLTTAENTARVCAELQLPLVTFSSALVFDGTASQPYVEDDRPNPQSEYSRAKFAAEQAVAACWPRALILRTGYLFGSAEANEATARVLRALASNRRVGASAEHRFSPTYIPDLAHAALDLLIDDESGLWHVATAGAPTWFEWTRQLARVAGYDPDRVVPASPRDLGWVAPRPRNATLGSNRGQLLSEWQAALRRFAATLPGDRGAVAA